ncbi:hydroxycarboxylic acid receptor 3-like [Rhinatrema bivittatum]|uniref:hydroxycarboxylic acid receptor 3-like n=1 Tax=Rhinatrema bivittatum TaxID=194408 RepID=UPI00112663E4|nr:hydroxycarboxylic acid receptor 3-like [Rhinatrema bivittatum]
MTNHTISCYLKENFLTFGMAAVLLCEFMVGLLGNGVALWILCFHMNPWKPSSVYLFSLSLADFSLIFCMPIRAYYFLQGKDWHFGDIPCRLFLFMISLNRAGSIFFLTAVAVDRYFRVVHPHHKINMTTKKGAIGTACMIWCFIVIMMMHLLTKPHLTVSEADNKTLCESFSFNNDQSPMTTWHNAFFVIEFVVPLGIIMFCTWSIVRQLRHQRKDKQGKIQKAAKSVTFVAFVFIFCFLPSTVATLALVISRSLNQCKSFEMAGVILLISLSLTYFNSMLNPVVFYFSNPTFQTTINQFISSKLLKSTKAAENEFPNNSSDSAHKTSNQMRM